MNIKENEKTLCIVQASGKEQSVSILAGCQLDKWVFQRGRKGNTVKHWKNYLYILPADRRANTVGCIGIGILSGAHAEVASSCFVVRHKTEVSSTAYKSCISFLISLFISNFQIWQFSSSTRCICKQTMVTFSLSQTLYAAFNFTYFRFYLVSYYAAELY